MFNEFNFKKNKQSLLIIFLLFLISTLYLFPYTQNGYWHDDAINSSIWGELHRAGNSLIALTWQVTRNWIRDAGRFIPLAFLQTYTAFYFIRDQQTLRLCHVLSVILNIILFITLLRKLKVTWSQIGLWFLVLLACLQMRDYNDPIASYSFFMQTQFMLFTTSLLFYLHWEFNNKWRFLVLSSFCLAFSLLIYEVNYIFYPMVVILLLKSQKNKDTLVKASAILFSPLLFYIPFNIFLRHFGNPVYVGNKFSFNTILPETYLKQFIAPFPYVHYLFKFQRKFNVIELAKSLPTNFISVLIFITALYVIFKLYEKISTSKEVLKSNPHYQKLKIIALSLVFIPPCFMAISKKYQDELDWGIGYLPVYYSYFGVALLILFYICNLKADNIRKKKTVLTLIALCLSINYLSNLRVFKIQEEKFSVSRNSLEKALSEGLLANLNDGDYVTLTNTPIYLSGGFFYQHSSKKVVLEGVEDISNGFNPIKPNSNPKHFKLDYDPALNKWELFF